VSRRAYRVGVPVPLKPDSVAIGLCLQTDAIGNDGLRCRPPVRKYENGIGDHGQHCQSNSRGNDPTPHSGEHEQMIRLCTK